MDLEQAVKDANKAYPGGCPACKGIRFKTCRTCGQEPNSFHDFREDQRPRQVYETRQEWEAVNGKYEPHIPERKQP